jgi:hypothetical protein
VLERVEPLMLASEGVLSHVAATQVVQLRRQ